MSALRGALRITLAFITIGVGGLLVVAVAWVPVRVSGARVGAWLTTLISRLGLWLFNIRVSCATPERFRQHRGLVFPNHISYFDILVLQSFYPMRWLSKHAVRAWPFVGWAVAAVGTVFVDRDDKASRTAARQQVADALRATPHPPLVLFPEGGIGLAGQLRPFRYGAFEIALAEQLACLPCAIVYSQPHIIQWWEESLLTALWRVARCSQPIHVEVLPQATLHPQPGDAASALARTAHHALAAALKAPPQMPLPTP